MKTEDHKTFLKRLTYIIQDLRLKMQDSRSFMFMYLSFGSKAKFLTIVEFSVTQKNTGWMKILKNRDGTPRSVVNLSCM